MAPQQKFAQVYFDYKGRKTGRCGNVLRGGSHSWTMYCMRRYRFPLNVLFFFATFIAVFLDILTVPFRVFSCFEKEGGNSIRLILLEEEVYGGEGYEGYMKGYYCIVKEGYDGDTFTAGFNQACHCSYQAKALANIKEILDKPDTPYRYCKLYDLPEHDEFYNDEHINEVSLENMKSMINRIHIEGPCTNCNCCFCYC
eukprot:m.241772 g.241772  ORF g.241772 m.241772 type:complete len:198 (+) comp26527_c0_seq1:146-739(+)